MSKRNEKSTKVPLKEVARLNGRALRIYVRHFPQMLVSMVLHAAAKALTPYVGIYLSARIIDELSGSRDVQVLTHLVLAVLISTAALALLTAALERWNNSRHAVQWHRRDGIYADKMLSMDFCSVDDSHTHDLFSQIRQNEQYSGWGLTHFYLGMEKLTTAVMRIAGAVALVVTLFTLRVPQGAGALTILNNPLCIVAIVAVMLTVTLAAPAFANTANAYWANHADDAKAGNRLFGFFGFMAHDRSRALDIRMYRQDILARRGMEKDKSFSPDSKIAGYARGPMGGYQALSAVVSNAFTGIVYVFVCLKAWGGAFGIGAVTQYIGAITQLSSGVSDLVSVLGGMRVNAAFLRTVFEFLDIPNNMYQGSLTVEKRSDRQYDIEFRNVSFRYPGTDAWALRNVTLKFRVGERLAVVGRNGSGKTTFIKLLCRLYDPTEGVILLNGIDIRKYNYLEYMSIFSVVFQDFKLLSFSLGQNVAAQAEYDREQAIDCLKQAGFGDRLHNMPQSTDTNLYKDFDEKGVEISGGEAQKIALARALYKDAPIVVLDEPTAALDPIARARHLHALQ